VSVLAAVALVVLLACLNVANLQLASAFARQREIGVRLALGATPRQVITTVMSESVPVVAAGVLTGLAGALLLGRYLETLLFEVAPTDPWSAVLAGSAAAALALMTSYVTARSAARIDPLTALRAE
jgi:putative ABC transport system permease protein